MITVNGEKDPWISPQEIPLLLETGEPKTARLIADGAHMAGEVATLPAQTAGPWSFSARA